MCIRCAVFCGCLDRVHCYSPGWHSMAYRIPPHHTTRLETWNDFHLRGWTWSSGPSITNVIL